MLKRTAQFILLFFLLGLSLGYVACNRQAPGKKQPAGKVDLSFKLYDYEGNAYTIESLKGRVVWMALWTTSCPYCLKLNQQLTRLSKKYDPNKVFFLGVALSSRGWQEVMPYLQRYGIEYTVVLGNHRLVEMLGGIRGVPANFVFNREGKLVMKFEGYLPQPQMERIINELLSKGKQNLVRR